MIHDQVVLSNQLNFLKLKQNICSEYKINFKAFKIRNYLQITDKISKEDVV